MEPVIKKIQTALFTKNFQIQNEYEKSNILLGLKEKVGEIFDGQPVLIPVPSDAPPEIPRIVLNSADNLFTCNVALNRIDIFFNLISNSEKDSDALLKKQKINSKKLFDFLKEKKVIINRVGFVVDIDYTIQNTLEFLRTEFIKDKKFESPKELSFRYNKSSNIDGVDIPMNNLVTITGKNDNNIIKVQFDINTVAEIMNAADFLSQEFESIIEYSISEVEKKSKNFPNI